MKRMVSVLLVLLLITFHVEAQENASSTTDSNEISPKATKPQNIKNSALRPHNSMRDNLFYGGYINLSFGNYMVIGIEPLVGYRWTTKLSTGIKLRYDYIRDDRYSKSYTTSNYGGSFFARYQITTGFYAQLEPASYNYELFYINGRSEREWVPFLFAGGGYTQPISERTWLNFQILFDLLQNEKSPYNDWEPFFSIGVGAGF